MKKTVQKKGGMGKAIAVGATVAAAAAAGYLLFGPEGEKNRKKMKGWMIRMKGEMIEKFEHLKQMTEPEYTRIVDSVAAKYALAKNVDKKDVAGVIRDARRHWKMLTQDVQKRVTTKKRAVAKRKKA